MPEQENGNTDSQVDNGLQGVDTSAMERVSGADTNVDNITTLKTPPKAGEADHNNPLLDGPTSEVDTKTTLNDYLKLKEGGHPDKSAAKVEPKKENETKTEVKKNETVKEEVKDTGPNSKATEKGNENATGGHEASKVVTKSGSRDYAGIPDSVVPLFKKMPNETYAFMRPLYDKNTALTKEVEEAKKEITKVREEKGLPESYLEHPDAYILSPDFQNNLKAVRTGESFLNHWQTQLENIESGKEWHELVPDGKGGWTNGPAITPLPAHKGTIISHITHVNGQLQRFRGDLQTVQSTFKSRQADAVKFVDGIRKEHFSAYQDEKNVMQPIIKEIEKVLPNFIHPSAKRLLAESLAACMQLKEAAKQANAKYEEATKKGAAKIEDVRKAGPTSEMANGGGTSTKVDGKELMANFAKLRQEH